MLYKIGGRGLSAATAVSNVRDTLDGAAEIDQPIVVDGRANIMPTDADGIAYSRTPQQVHNIVFGNPAQGVTRGGFFPEGTNGRLTSS